MSKSENTVDHVLDRMVEAMLGEDAHFNSHATALNIPRETIKTWKRRGEVPLGTLKNFAFDWKVSLDWLQHGDHPKAEPAQPHLVSENVRPYGLSADEAALLETYREIDPEARVTLQDLLKVIATAGHADAVVKAPKAAPAMPRTAKVYSGERTGKQKKVEDRIEIRTSERPSKKFTPPKKRGGEG